jgi:hypothetical protein
LVWAIDDALAHGLLPAVQTASSSTPLYVVGEGQPRLKVTLDTGSWGDSLRAALADGVPIPPGATPAAGTDGHLAVYQPSTDTMWEFFQASLQADGWHASWGGAMQHVSSNPGYFSNAAWPGLAPNDGWHWGSTASSLPVAAGLVLGKELRAGSIPHAVAAAVPHACADAFVWPAQRTDGDSRASDCIPEGAHLRLDPTLNVDALNLSPVARALAHAAQTYGIIVRDQTLGSFAFLAEDPATAGADTYSGANSVWGGVADWQALDRFPWSSLQMLDAPVCTRAPCGSG